MSAHDGDPAFAAAVRAIVGAASETLPKMLAEVTAAAPHLAGHERCIEGTVLRSLFGAYVATQAAAAAAGTGLPEVQCRARVLAYELEAVAAALGIGIRAVPVAPADTDAAPASPTTH